MFESIQRAFSRRSAPALIVLGGTLAVCASLDAGLAADDLLHQLILEGSNAFSGFQRPPWDLFRFAAPASNQANLDDGIFPWWADPAVRFAFFRPIAAWTHMVDHALFPRNAVWMHLHSVLWWALSAVAVGAVYRQLVSPRWAAVLALFLYALDDARGAPVAWVANRNALIGCAVSVWAVYAFHRTADQSWKPGHWLGPAALGVGLLASEGSIAVLAYLFAYSIFLDRRPPMKRVTCFAPYALVTLAWLGLSRSLGYGVSGSSVYLDPIGDAGRFLRVLPERFLVLAYAQIGGPWSELWNGYPFLFPGLQYYVLGTGVLTLAFVAWLFVPLWRRSCRVRFWLTGATLAVVPSCAAFPADRLLLWVGIGAMGAIAELLSAFARRELPRHGARKVLATGGVAGFAVVHGLVGPLLLPMRSRGIEQVRESIERVDRTIPASPEVATKTLVYVNAPADPFASFIPIRREALGIPRARRQRWLATGSSAVSVERIDEQTLLVRPDGGFVQTPSEALLRSPTYLSRVGDQAHVDGMRVTIAEVTGDGRPLAARVRFAVPLENPELEFLVWRGAAYTHFRIPSVGQTANVPAVDLLRLAFGDESLVTRALRPRLEKGHASSTEDGTTGPPL